MNVVESGDEDIRSDFAPGFHQILDAADGKVIGKIEETGNGRVPLQCLSCLLITDLRKGVDVVMFLEVAEIYVITLYELLFRDFRKICFSP